MKTVSYTASDRGQCGPKPRLAASRAALEGGCESWSFQTILETLRAGLSGWVG